MKKTGILYGIGVGPGDPDLIALKAVSVLRSVKVVFAAASSKNNYSQAVNIAKPHIPEETTVNMLSFPMTKDKNIMRSAWQENARSIISELEKGNHAAFLTLGDCMTYSTYGYIIRHVKEMAPHIQIQSIPGITSYQAAAARMNTPLMEGEESLLVLSGVTGGHHLRKRLGDTENVVFLKAYKNADDIVAAVEEAGLMENSFGIVNCGNPDEEIIFDIRELKERKPGYWTLVIAKQAQRNGTPK